MRYVVFGLGQHGALLLKLLNLNIQSGIELTGYFHVVDNSKLKLLSFHHNVGEIRGENIKFTEVSSINVNLLYEQSFDKIYILGPYFDFRQQLLDFGFDYRKISMCYGDVEYCHCPLDEIFIIPKKTPKVPFKRGPAEIYQKYAAETYKSHNRRIREGFFDKYCKGEGLDICYGADILLPTCSGWDFRNGDAQYLAGIEDETFDFAYSSHGLEHMYNVRIALKNWFRVVKKGGFLILAIPHRDLYEKKKTLPSLWNGDHKHMFLIGRSEPPDTLDIVEEIKYSLENYDIKYVKACDEGHIITDPSKHSDGEYQIEIVIQKLPPPLDELRALLLSIMLFVLCQRCIRR